MFFSTRWYKARPFVPIFFGRVQYWPHPSIDSLPDLFASIGVGFVTLLSHSVLLSRLLLLIISLSKYISPSPSLSLLSLFIIHLSLPLSISFSHTTHSFSLFL
jgi:hypothetical protein